MAPTRVKVVHEDCVQCGCCGAAATGYPRSPCPYPHPPERCIAQGVPAPALRSAELLLAAQQLACVARTDARTGALVCPVRTASSACTGAPTPLGAGLSKPLARRHITQAAGQLPGQRCGGSAVGCRAQTELAGAAQHQEDGHSVYHAHAKDLVQHMHAQHAPVAMVSTKGSMCTRMVWRAPGAAHARAVSA